MIKRYEIGSRRKKTGAAGDEDSGAVNAPRSRQGFHTPELTRE
jgi:hypothetical protein